MSGLFNNSTALNALAGGFYGKVTVTKTLAERAANVLYTNSSGRPRFVSVNITGIVAGVCDAFLESSAGLLYSGNAVYSNATVGNTHFTLIGAIINNGENYRLIIPAGSISVWVETS